MGKFKEADKALAAIKICLKCKTRNDKNARMCRKCKYTKFRPKKVKRKETK